MNDLFKFYKVGGYVRDIILGMEPEDIDYTVVYRGTIESETNHVEIFDSLCEYLAKDYKITIKTPKYLTVKAKDKNGVIIDFVLARKESGYIEGTRAPILGLGNIYDDLIRRDFTINALAIDCDTGEIVDICGGLLDISNKTLRTVKDARISLYEDPLRVMRGLRLSITKNFSLDVEFWKVLSEGDLWKKLNCVVSPGRIRHELDKMFKYDTIKTLNLLHQVNIVYSGGYESILKNITIKPCVDDTKN